MNKLKLQAELLDLGVISEEDIVYIKESSNGLYITVISGLNNVASYIFQDNELVIVEGNNIHVNDILKMKELDLNEI